LGPYSLYDIVANSLHNEIPTKRRHLIGPRHAQPATVGSRVSTVQIERASPILQKVPRVSLKSHPPSFSVSRICTGIRHEGGRPAAWSVSIEPVAGTSAARARCHLLLPVPPRCLLLHRCRNPRERREAAAGPAALEHARCPTMARSNNSVGAQSRIAGRAGPCSGRGERRPPSRGATRRCQPLLKPLLAPHLLLARHCVASPPLLATTTSP
jgi:hypothetical protein